MKALQGTTMTPLLEVQDLSVSFPWHGERRPVVSGVSFAQSQGEMLVLVGESGSGKTVLSRALTNLFPAGEAARVKGRVTFDGGSVLELGPEGLSRLRRRRIRYVFQEPMRALNPVTRIAPQMRLGAEGVRLSDNELEEALRKTGIEDPARILRSFPHQLSTGMAQRVMIAMALLPRPALVIADEPTSAVDASLRSHLMALLLGLQRSERMAMLLITHDLEAARASGGRIMVMLAGRIVEAAPAPAFFAAPLHPYSRLILEGAPALMQAAGGENEGAGDMEDGATGCAFAPQCPCVRARCRTEAPPLALLDDNRQIRCFS